MSDSVAHFRPSLRTGCDGVRRPSAYRPPLNARIDASTSARVFALAWVITVPSGLTNRHGYDFSPIGIGPTLGAGKETTWRSIT